MKRKETGLSNRANFLTPHDKRKERLFPYSFAITKGIPVGFYFYSALTDMFKFSAYPCLN